MNLILIETEIVQQEGFVHVFIFPTGGGGDDIAEYLILYHLNSKHSHMVHGFTALPHPHTTFITQTQPMQIWEILHHFYGAVIATALAPNICLYIPVTNT